MTGPDLEPTAPEPLRTDHPDVPLAEVARESPEDSVEREGDALWDREGDDATPAGLESSDVPPDEPATTSLSGFGPVSGGDDVTI